MQRLLHNTYPKYLGVKHSENTLGQEITWSTNHAWLNGGPLTWHNSTLIGLLNHRRLCNGVTQQTHTHTRTSKMDVQHTSIMQVISDNIRFTYWLPLSNHIPLLLLRKESALSGSSIIDNYQPLIHSDVTYLERNRLLSTQPPESCMLSIFLVFGNNSSKNPALHTFIKANVNPPTS